MDEDVKTYRVLLSGRVQGVGFRYFAVDRATVNNVKGYVKNTSDNRVEVICQGIKSDIEMFMLELKKGPSFANVTDFRIETIDSSPEYLSFEINY